MDLPLKPTLIWLISQDGLKVHFYQTDIQGFTSQLYGTTY